MQERKRAPKKEELPTNQENDIPQPSDFAV